MPPIHFPPPSTMVRTILRAKLLRTGLVAAVAGWMGSWSPTSGILVSAFQLVPSPFFAGDSAGRIAGRMHVRVKLAPEGDEKEPPSFPEDIYAPAIDLLSDPYFSPDPNLEEQRKKILGKEPLFMITFQYQKEAKEKEEDPLDRRKMAADLGLNREALLRFFNQPFDRILSEVGIYPLRRSDIVIDYLKRHVERPKARAMFKAQNRPGNVRDYPLTYVVGPIESGKTFFALHYMKDFGNDDGLPSVLIYWQPWIWCNKLDFADEESAPTDLVERFFERMGWRTESGYERRWNPQDDKLNLHVCLVLDEADNREQLGFFAKRSMVTTFVQELEATEFAKSLMVVVVGSFLDAELGEFDEAKDAYFFRTKGWTDRDAQLLQSKRARPSDP
jgi:hypothetical protein